LVDVTIPEQWVDLGDLPSPPYPTYPTLPHVPPIGGPSHLPGWAVLGDLIDIEPEPFGDGGGLLGTEDNGLMDTPESQDC